MARIAERIRIERVDHFHAREESVDLAVRIFHDWNSEITVFEFDDGTALRIVGQVVSVGLYAVTEPGTDRELCLECEPYLVGPHDAPVYLAAAFDEHGKGCKLTWLPDDWEGVVDALDCVDFDAFHLATMGR